MSWNASVESQINNNFYTAKKQVADNLPVIVDRTPAAVLNIANAAQQIQTSKNAVESGLESMRRYANGLSSSMSQAIHTSSDTNDDIARREAIVKGMKLKVKAGKQLYEVRKEQAAALQHRDESNYHSSWLGLWRPLRESTRTGLMIAAVVSGLAALLSIGFMIAIEFQMLPELSPPSASNASGFVSGIFKSLFDSIMKAVRILFGSTGASNLIPH